MSNLTAPRTRLRPPPRVVVFGGLALLGFAVTWVSGVYYLRHRTDRAIRDAVAATNRLDPGWTLEELEAKRAVLADDENSAVRVRQVKQKLPAQWPPTPVPVS